MKSLDENILRLKTDKTVFEAQLTLLEDYAKAMDVKKADLPALNSFFDLYTEQKRKIQSDLAEVGAELEDLDNKLQARRNQLYQSNVGVKRGSTVTVIITCGNDGKAELSMWYCEYHRISSNARVYITTN